MKKTVTRRSRSDLKNTITLAAALCTLHASANPFDDGMAHTNSTDTAYNEPVYVGYFNPDNTLIVNNDSTLNAKRIIIGNTIDSTNNLLKVEGNSLLITGSTSTNGLMTGGIVVGDAGSFSAITINNASKLEAEYLYVGFGTNDTGTIALSDKGTELTIAQDAYVGYAGSSNSVSIGSGSAMNVGGMLTVGLSGSNNTVNVSGTLFVNTTNDIHVVGADVGNGITVKGGGTLQVGGDVDAGTLSGLGVDMLSKAALELGGSLTLPGSTIDNSYGVILNNALSTNTASWQSSSLTIIGETTSNNSLIFTNGASGTVNNIVQLGQESTANNNTLIIGGSNSLFSAKNLSVGNKGDNNKVRVLGGGALDIQERLYLGFNTLSSGNEATVGSNAVLTAGSDVVVGVYGSKNTFNIDYGRVSVANDFILGSRSINNRYLQTGGTNTVAGAFIIGMMTNATGKTGFVDGDSVETTGNLAIVGEDATLDIQQNLTVGREGGGSILTVRDGGTVNVARDAVIGESVKDNYIYLQRDADTRLHVAGDLEVGRKGGSNRFAIYGGTANIDGNLYLGSSTNQHVEKNFIHVETTNAVLNVANAIYIGASNSINTFDLVDGANANAQDLFVGTYDGVSNNVVTVTGDESLLSISNMLAIGSSSGSNNAVNVRNGGTLYVSDQSNIVIGSATNNTLKVADQGILKTHDWNFALQTNQYTNIVFETGSTLHLLGVLEGTNMVEGGFNLVLDGVGSAWETAAGNLYVGYETDNNSLTITNGATASTLTNLYIGFISQDNIVTLGGAGSLLEIGGDLYIGNDTNSSAFNTLALWDEANVTVGNDVFLYQGAVLKIAASSQVTVGGDYTQDGYSTLEVGVSSNQVQPNLTVAGNAGFSTSKDTQEYSLIRVFDEGVGESNVITIVQAKTITLDGNPANTGSIEGSIATNLLLGFTASISNGLNNSFIVLDDFIRRGIGEAGGLEGQLLDVANEVDAMADAGNPNASNMVHIIEGMSSESEINTAFSTHFGEKDSSTPVNNVLGLGIQGVAGQLTVRADNTRARMGAASASIDWDKPAGAAGPHQSGQPLQGWVAGYGTWGSQDRVDGYNGYTADIRGFLIGADLAVADNILVGIAGGSGSSTIDKDNGGTSDLRTTYASIYTSLGTQSWFADASFIYGGSSVKSAFGSAFDTTADYDARNIAFYLGGGKEIIGEYLIFTPQASLLANFYEQDQYEEKSSVVARSVEGFDDLYVRSAIGCNLGFYAALGDATLKPELRLHWLHEFNGDEQSLNYSLIGGDGTMHTLLIQAPEQDVINLGAGIAARMSEFLEFRFDLDTRQSANYSDFTLLGSLRYQF